MFQGRTVHEHFEFGDFYAYEGIPNAWGFLTFCAGWTILAVIFNLVTKIVYPDRVLTSYIRVAFESVAVLSWLAGFIAVAVQISTNTCPAGEKSCGLLIAATVLGAIEWLLFMITAGWLLIAFFFNRSHKQRASMKKRDAAV